jgi:hypothetical protein
VAAGSLTVVTLTVVSIPFNIKKIICFFVLYWNVEVVSIENFIAFNLYAKII